MKYEKIINNFEDWRLHNGKISSNLANRDDAPYPLLFTVEPYKPSVSRNQQKYYYGAVLPAMRSVMQEHTPELKMLNEKQFDHVVRVAIGYTEDITVRYEEEGMDCMYMNIPKSLSFTKGKQEEVSAYIQSCIVWAKQHLDLDILSSEEYYESLGIKK